MPDTIILGIGTTRAFVTIPRTVITCPGCEHQEDVAELLDAKMPKRWYWIRRCKKCNLQLGITYDMTGDWVCWDKVKADLEEKSRPKEPEPTQEEIDAFLSGMPPYDEGAEEQRISDLISDIKNDRKTDATAQQHSRQPQER